ncbi:hypothetical protein [Sphingobacterium faecale]|uniref:Lipoprotein n=1 Tax=Sphingobacterium faecale TaxID=2803775 RepID=A0ABS1R501_9SPHI|nr:hypothetical protein [Sphingobacterium faecale]MBL1408911.1 hypothetical protein [Sphingobacterium faecale]
MRIVFKGFFYMLGLGCCLTVACNSASPEEGKDTIAGEYLFQSEGDTINMALQQKKDSVFGDLNYAFSGKDRNVGRINGVLRDSVITGEYSFVSEGIPSVRQVVFKLTEQGLIEGYGEIEESNGKMVFSDLENLSFDHGMILKKK